MAFRLRWGSFANYSARLTIASYAFLCENFQISRELRLNNG